MGTIRLGKRTEGRSPLIRDFVPLANLQDIVFGGWDIYEDTVYDAAIEAGVLERPLIESVKDGIETIRPMKAVFDHEFVKRLDGPNVKKGKTKLDLAKQLMEDIARFRKEKNCARLVMIWCGSTEVFLKAEAVHESLRGAGSGQSSVDRAEHDLRLRGSEVGVPSPTARRTSRWISRAATARGERQVPVCGKTSRRARP
jgi:myo-inositol-1-phosphate synthase